MLTYPRQVIIRRFPCSCQILLEALGSQHTTSICSMLLFCYVYDNTHWGVIIVLLFCPRVGEAPSDFDRKAALCNSRTDPSLQAVQPPSAPASPTEQAGSLCSQCLSCGTKQTFPDFGSTCFQWEVNLEQLRERTAKND